MLGKHHSEESRKKIGDSNRGKIRSEAIINNIRILNTGKVHSEETKKRMSESHKKQFSDPEFKERHRLSLLGRVVTEETRKKIRESNIGKTRDTISKKRMSDSANKRWSQIEQRDIARLNQLKFILNNPEHLEFLRKAMTGRKHSVESRKKMGLKTKGENNPRWNGDITSFRKQIHECFRMVVWRESVFKRDNYADWFSGVSGTASDPIEAHHVVRLSALLKKYNIRSLEDAEVCEELWDAANGITLLKSSHRMYHSLWGY